MNKRELVDALSDETAFSKKDVSRVLESLLSIIKRTLKGGSKVALTGFGHFAVKERKARDGINPATGQKIKLPAISVVGFRSGKDLSMAVRGTKL